jgi:hypothetical protein
MSKAGSGGPRRITLPCALEAAHNHHNFAWREHHEGKDLWVVRKGATPVFPCLSFASSSPKLKMVSSTCRVTFTDGADVTHTVTVCASSLYEAAARGIAEFKKTGFAFASIGTATRLKIAVEPPATIHELSVGRLQVWLDTNGKTPRGRPRKSRFDRSSECSRAGAR